MMSDTCRLIKKTYIEKNDTLKYFKLNQVQPQYVFCNSYSFHPCLLNFRIDFVCVCLGGVYFLALLSCPCSCPLTRSFCHAFHKSERRLIAVIL